MKNSNKYSIVLTLSLVSCSGDENNTESFDENPICGNLIEELDEECDSDFEKCISCKYPRMIFINSNDLLSTSEINSKSFEELSSLCVIQADLNGFNTNKKWEAWISKNNNDIKDRLYNSPGLYINYTGDIIAYSFEDLTDGTINNPILYNQSGFLIKADVWTGTLFNGTSSPSNCNNWSLNDGIFGTIGNTNTISKDWTSSEQLGNCSDRKHFYCIESEYLL